MKYLYFSISFLLAAGWVLVLNTNWLLPVRLGALLSPQQGIWQNAEPAGKAFAGQLDLTGLKGKVDVYFDERLVPHVYAKEESDAWFAQGYLHASFRLWQMELQTMAAAGRAAEVAGEVALDHDREYRRLGMVYAAENALKAIESNDTTRDQINSYTAGVNAYLSTLTASGLPLEYKLLDYSPEPWTNLKTALLLKLMSYELAGYERDLEMTNARDYFTPSDFSLLFPYRSDSSVSVVPGNEFWPRDSSGHLLPQTVSTALPDHADSVYFRKPAVVAEEFSKPDPDNGSNNWVVGPSRTRSGAPILCNDPHLALRLPSLWYEMQITVPGFSVYGVSLPGAPGIVIGFNENCAFGLTNSDRDVRDYYEISFAGDDRSAYYYDGVLLKTQFRYEEIKIKGKPTYIDTVAYTIFGPVMFDNRYGGKRSNNKNHYAVRWKGHDPGNELLFCNRLNRMRNYDGFRRAISELHTPGQNCVFACGDGDIAIVAQGEFPAKWKGQGDFVMPGNDPHYIWRNFIPENELPSELNPPRGYVSSANQFAADSSYPYYLGRNYSVSRAMYINRNLDAGKDFTIGDMMALQNSNHSLFAEWAVPLVLKYLDESRLRPEEKKYLEELKAWDHNYEAESPAAGFFENFWTDLMDVVYEDEFANAPQPVAMPNPITLLEAIRRDSAYKFIDNIITLTVESVGDVMLMAFRSASRETDLLAKEKRQSWYSHRNTHIDHLLRLPSFGISEVKSGGCVNCINSIKEKHGPGWRMIVEMNQVPEAYGIYAGGQSGNPGSRYYDDFVAPWTKGKYFRLHLMTEEQAGQNDGLQLLNLAPENND